MAKIQPRAGFWPQLDKTWSGPRVLGQHSLEGRVLVQHSLEGCCGHSLERRTGHSLERRTGHSLEGRCAVALGLCRGTDQICIVTLLFKENEFTKSISLNGTGYGDCSRSF